MTDYAENPTPRILAAESRREMGRPLDEGSFGTPGARVMRDRAGRDVLLTPSEQAAVDTEMDALERELGGSHG